ncbi:hypothetical protein FJZ26_02945 [Candidatus Parvarchaeota archaeon]|nr:hypothetical protein [Candidatus Parvarchaeota archaeon]
MKLAFCNTGKLLLFSLFFLLLAFGYSHSAIAISPQYPNNNSTVYISNEVMISYSAYVTSTPTKEALYCSLHIEKLRANAWSEVSRARMYGMNGKIISGFNTVLEEGTYRYYIKCNSYSNQETKSPYLRFIVAGSQSTLSGFSIELTPISPPPNTVTSSSPSEIAFSFKFTSSDAGPSDYCAVSVSRDRGGVFWEFVGFSGANNIESGRVLSFPMTLETGKYNWFVYCLGYRRTTGTYYSKSINAGSFKVNAQAIPKSVGVAHVSPDDNFNATTLKVPIKVSYKSSSKSDGTCNVLLYKKNDIGDWEVFKTYPQFAAQSDRTAVSEISLPKVGFYKWNVICDSNSFFAETGSRNIEVPPYFLNPDINIHPTASPTEVVYKHNTGRFDWCNILVKKYAAPNTWSVYYSEMKQPSPPTIRKSISESGYYAWAVNCGNYYNLEYLDTGYNYFGIGTETPQVRQQTPEDNFKSPSQRVGFSYSYNSTQIPGSCDLGIEVNNSTRWQPYANDVQNIPPNSLGVYQRLFEPGQYRWKVKCSQVNGAFNTTGYRHFTAPANVTLLAPENNKIISSNTVTFSYHVGMYLRGGCKIEVFGKDSTGGWGSQSKFMKERRPLPGSIDSFQISGIPYGDYRWNVKCYANSNSPYTSGYNYFNVGTSPDAGSGSGGGATDGLANTANQLFGFDSSNSGQQVITLAVLTAIVLFVYFNYFGKNKTVEPAIQARRNRKPKKNKRRRQ